MQHVKWTWKKWWWIVRSGQQHITYGRPHRDHRTGQHWGPGPAPGRHWRRFRTRDVAILAKCSVVAAVRSCVVTVSSAVAVCVCVLRYELNRHLRLPRGVSRLFSYSVPCRWHSRCLSRRRCLGDCFLGRRRHILVLQEHFYCDLNVKLRYVDCCVPRRYVGGPLCWYVVGCEYDGRYASSSNH